VSPSPRCRWRSTSAEDCSRSKPASAPDLGPAARGLPRRNSASTG
jgi:hypothetical protein